MAEVGLAFLSASLSVLFDRMASPEVADFMQGRKQTEKLSRKLKIAMRSVNAVLADAEEKQLTDTSVKDWVDDLKDVLFDAEDILDEIATEALQRKLDAESSTTAEKKKNMAEVGIAFLSALLGVVFQKIASPGVVDFVYKQKSTEQLLKKLEIALLPLNVVLEDAEEKQITNRNVKRWIDELKDAAYTAEDILDEIATVALRRHLHAEFKPVAGKSQVHARRGVSYLTSCFKYKEL